VSGVLAAPVLPTINLFIHPSSISPPSGGGVRREKEEMKEGMQMAIELGNPGKHPVLWGQGLISPRHPSRSVSP